jgi:hypothetical protein
MTDPLPKKFHDAEAVMGILVSRILEWFEGPPTWGTDLCHPWVDRTGFVYAPSPFSRGVFSWRDVLTKNVRRRNERAHPVVTPDILAAYRLGGYDAVVSHWHWSSGGRTRANYFKPCRLSHYHPQVFSHWVGRVDELVELCQARSTVAR